jgi:predicted acyltransferase (DUF342 family)
MESSRAEMSARKKQIAVQERMSVKTSRLAKERNLARKVIDLYSNKLSKGSASVGPFSLV